MTTGASGWDPGSIATAISLPLSIVPSDVPSSLVGASLPTTLVVDTNSLQGPPASTIWTVHSTTTVTSPGAVSSSSWPAPLGHIPPLTTQWSTAVGAMMTTSLKGSQTALGSVEGSVPSTASTVSPTSLVGESAAARGARRGGDKILMAFLALCLILSGL